MFVNKSLSYTNLMLVQNIDGSEAYSSIERQISQDSIHKMTEDNPKRMRSISSDAPFSEESHNYFDPVQEIRMIRLKEKDRAFVTPHLIVSVN